MPRSLICVFFILIPFCVFSFHSAYAQRGISAISKDITVSVAVTDSVVSLGHWLVLPASERAILDSTILIARGKDYSMDYVRGTMKLLSDRWNLLKSDQRVHHITVTFKVHQQQLQRSYALREINVLPDTGTGMRRVRETAPVRSLGEELFGAGLQKSGSIARGFTVGSNRDLTLSSGFRMQLNGRLSDDVGVTAALTDENTPIQPEGTTQTLREVDKVFIEVKGRSLGATLGDFTLEQTGREAGEFGKISRKLQGARGFGSFNGVAGTGVNLSSSLTAATARGKFTTNHIQGLEGTQGPYRLSGVNGESRLLVIAGSERVYLNGEVMTRGELNDYTIDYASGEITFTTKRLITSASRITVDFEYTDREFARNFVGATLSGSDDANRFHLNTSFVQEADDPDAPLDISLDQRSRDILAQSGGDRLKAVLPGIKYAGVDTATGKGLGQYLTRDTTINGRIYSILVYAPGDSLAFYTAIFSPIESVPPDSAGYVRVATGQFRFAGLGQGNYLPVQFLPMPQKHQLFNVNGSANLAHDLTIGGELATSAFDLNRLSSDPAKNIVGNASKFNLQYVPSNIQIGGRHFGSLELVASHRSVEKSFVPVDRANEVEFDRKWNLDTRQSSNEELTEAGVTYKPRENVWGSLAYGSLHRPGEVSSTRWQTELHLSDSSLPRIDLRREDISASTAALGDRSRWIRQRGEASYVVRGITPSLRVENEDRFVKAVASDTAVPGSFRFVEIAPRISVSPVGKLSGSAEWQMRGEDSLSVGSVRRAFDALTQSYAVQLSEWNTLSSTFMLSLRNVRFTDEFKSRGNSNQDVLLVRSQTRYAPFQQALQTEAFYEFSNQRSARLERVFVRVAQGRGNYRYKGDLNGNGIADENEFELTRFDGDYILLYLPSEQLYPIGDLKASIRFRFQPARLIRTPASALERVLNVLSSETFLRVDERSNDPDSKAIYFLNFSHFLNDQTTVTGSNQITQDLFVLEGSPDLSFRLRYSERNGLLQLVSATERSLQREKSIRVRSQLIPEIGNQTDIAWKNDRVTPSMPNGRERDLAITSLNTDFSYRPEQQIEVGFVFGLSEITDSYINKNAAADLNDQGFRLVYAFPGIGQLRGEMRREEATLSNVPMDPLHPLPFEFTNGRAVGKSYLWQVTFDYRLTSSIQITASYSGRSEGGRDPVHTARAEARAFF